MLLQSLFFRNFLAVCLFFSYHNAAAQSKLELKANLLPVLLSSRAELSGEYFLSDRIGIEAGIGYEWGESRIGYTDTTSANGGVIWTTILKGRLVNYYLSGKYYFSPKHGGDRFFAGAIIHHQYYASHVLNGQNTEKPDSVTGIGIEPGYKWAIKKKIVIEIGMRGLFKLGKNGFGDRTIDFDPAFNGKLGYRF